MVVACVLVSIVATSGVFQPCCALLLVAPLSRPTHAPQPLSAIAGARTRRLAAARCRHLAAARCHRLAAARCRRPAAARRRGLAAGPAALAPAQDP